MATEKNYGNMKMFLIALLAINVLLLIYIGFFKRDAYRLETLKVGGRDNMKMAIQLYESDAYVQQQRTTLEQILDSMGADAAIQDDTADATDIAVAGTTAVITGDIATFVAIKNDGHIFGNENARITIIEYSDLLCQFCKRHHNNKTIENLINKYPNDVNMVFRQMPLPQLHPTAPLGAQAAICAGKLDGADMFYDYIAKAFAANEFTEENVTEMAITLGINKSRFAECLNSADTIATVNAQVQEGQRFGISGTPGTLVVDNEKGTYVVIAGAYPSETFEAEIIRILGQ